MSEQREKPISTLVFAVNGEKFELSEVDPSSTLLQFLRSYTRFKSVKLSCGEGGCSACVVLLSTYDPKLGRVDDYVVNSCLTLLCSINRCSVTTSEGFGNSKDGFHSIHQRFAGFHASQCGFCTPGMCVSLFSALVNAEKGPRQDPPKGFSKLTVAEAEVAVAGNLCRCTGYRPIADACKSFASDVDLEDLGINSFWNQGDSTIDRVRKLPYHDWKSCLCTFPKFLKRELEFESPVALNYKEKTWLSPRNVEELCNLLESNLGKNRQLTKLVVGNTGTGYYKEMEQYGKYIDLGHIHELSLIKRDDDKLEIGATVTLSRSILALKEESKRGEIFFWKIASHFEKIATGPIRNTASIGGNLVMAQRNKFPSDIATILLAVNSRVNLISGLERRKVTLEEFLAGPPLDARSVLLSIEIPCWKPVKDGDTKLFFETYRASPRPLGNALAFLTAAFVAYLTPSKEGALVNSIRLSFGALRKKHGIRAKTLEHFLTGKVVNVSVLYEAVNLVKSFILAEDGTSEASYHASLAVGFLFQFFRPVVDVSCNLVLGDNLLDEVTNGVDSEKTLLSSGKQLVELSKEYFPVGQPITKSGAALQASGEAVYVDDIPSPANCLHGAFVYSTKPLALVKDIKLESKSVPTVVDAVISFKDIPEGGENVGSKTVFGVEPLFAEDLTVCAGQRLALLVAGTQKDADMAAEMATVEYDTEGVGLPILTVEQAVEKSSFFEPPPFLLPSPVGDFSKGMAEADQKILSAQIKLGSQYYFYMETQTALAVPDEDNCIVVYSSMQCPEYAHTVIARCLGIPEHNVRVITRRVGGGFGGKAIRAMPVATACALAAHKLRRPVRTYLNRKTDMIISGGRHPMKITYSIGFKSNGKITALHLDILILAGMSADVSPIIPINMMGCLKKYDWGALSFNIKICKTNHTCKSAMRAPGEVQGSFIAEAVLEHVASVLSVDVDSIRYTNLHTFESLKFFYPDSAGEPGEYTLLSVWDRLAKNSVFDRRCKMVKILNSRHKWKKRGISRVPIVYPVMLRPTPGKVSILWDGSVVVEVGGIELGQGLWTKVKQMAAFALSSNLCDGTEDLLDKVRVIQSDTLSLVQGGFTAGSTTSESSCEAVRICCSILVERLTSLKKKLQDETGAVKWDLLILEAHYQSVNLSASTYFVPDFASMQYLNYGAAVSEVEVNLLTGETKILRTDIIYDCGQSMNPAVDLGQIEGAFVQGIGFFMLEEYLTNSEGLVVSEGTWTYKIPTIDTIPKQFNVQIMNSGHHQKRILSSKACGEPPLLLAVSVHCATRAAIRDAREQLLSWGGLDASDSVFQLGVPATMPVIKKLCGLDNVERYLQSLMTSLPSTGV